MATVAIEVQRYKLIYRVAHNALKGLMDRMAEDFMADINSGYLYHALPHPDFVCDHCGYDNPDGNFKDNVCPRCDRQAITKNQYLDLMIT